ncbi:alpha/beta hydrolase [Pseudomonas sp. 5P_3.1_Bac2]|uniref:alpha/beta hydrolase n=1 Tax=Pseudomonas sp. 5P_3.1_Bac2 TaxID=2971617 RepID=UPI0021C906AB|nr:alpha/beta hydrolase [Pseudomonas sp. 5P_3.1_Bac2]MCU1717289.1 alpha/beta hydrolase [Pseudomonas sp. 5P_3.1_Bac2]
MNNTNELLELAKNMRSSYRSLIPSAGSPDEVYKLEDISIPSRDTGRAIEGKLYYPRGNAAESITVFAHGGWWVSGDLETHDVLLRYLANNLNTLVLSVGYRLAPEHCAPAATNDVTDAFHWLHKRFSSIKKTFLVGDSAGGNIMASLSTQLNAEHKVSGVWLIYPVLDVNMNPESLKRLATEDFPTLDILNMFKQSYTAGQVGEQDPLVSPVFADNSNIPPTLISVGEADPLIERSRDYHNAAPNSKLLTYAKQRHGFIQFFKNKQYNALGQQALDDGIEFLKSVD